MAALVDTHGINVERVSIDYDGQLLPSILIKTLKPLDDVPVFLTHYSATPPGEIHFFNQEVIMLFYKNIEVADNEKAFLYRRKRFERVLEPGRYRYFDLLGEIRVEGFDITRRELDGLAIEHHYTTE